MSCDFGRVFLFISLEGVIISLASSSLRVENVAKSKPPRVPVDCTHSLLFVRKGTSAQKPLSLSLALSLASLLIKQQVIRNSVSHTRVLT